MAIRKIDNRTFRMERDVMEVTPLAKPDDDWEFTDSVGHLHRWQNGRLPSLKEIIDCSADGEYPALTHMECERCGETIAPGYKSPESREFIHGLTHLYIDDVEVGKSEFEKEFATHCNKGG